MPRFCVLQAFLTLFLPWSSHLPSDSAGCPIGLLSNVSVSQQHVVSGFALDYPLLLRQDFGPAASSTTTSIHAPVLSSWQCDCFSSGHGSSGVDMAFMPRFCVLQVRNQFSLYSKRNDDPYLLLLPCPGVLYEIACDCFSMFWLLLRCGDVETNPGPFTRSEALLDLDTLPDEPSEQMSVIFHLLKDLHARSVQSAKSRAELVADVKSIKSGLKNIETKIGHIQTRLDALEEKTKALDSFDTNLVEIQDSVKVLTTQHDSMLSRLDELEDRSRRDNLLFYGITDSRESWEQSEAHIKRILTGVLDTLPENSIERAHRLGPHTPNKCRPIIVKFSGYKVKDKILSARAKLKEINVTVSEDFSPATRNARRKLIEFAKNQPESPIFQLRYNKLVINKKQYMFDFATESVIELAPQRAPDNLQPSTSARHER